MGLRQKKQPKRGSSSMERSPEKMKQTEALHEFIQRVEAMAKSNQFSVNLEFAVRYLKRLNLICCLETSSNAGSFSS